MQKNVETSCSPYFSIQKETAGKVIKDTHEEPS